MKALLALCLSCASLSAETLHFEIPTVPAPSEEGFKLGTSTTPDGHTLGINSRCLTRDGKPWMPVMGEFHFSRYPAEQWREELLRMKAGGIDIASTYVFWNHHEEEEGVWRWAGDRDLRRFIQLCKETGMLAAVRLGPWCHGEVRNGGIPDWVLDEGWKLRGNDPAYLKGVATLYGQIGQQLDGLLWKDGGPVIMAQVENEYRGRPDHLLELKRLAREAGIDVPIYTRTGWPALASPMPFGEIAPLFGAYAEGFWDRQLRSMPGKYWAAFRFMETRTDAAIATEQLGDRAARDEADAHRYPYLTCELGGGMMSSYHRRILMHPEDVEAVALVKVGSGGNLPGYYMYHGGVNPEGKLSTLMEEQATRMTNYNDMPVKNYDFQAPLGSFGQTRPHYHWLRRLHLMFRDFGDVLAPMPAFFPKEQPGDKSDLTTLRAAVRTDGRSGFLFVNNHQRGATMPKHRDVSFSIKRDGREQRIPATPVSIPSNACFVWPVNLDLGFGVTLDHATAQPICRIEEPHRKTYFFTETKGIPPKLVLSGAKAATIGGFGALEPIAGNGGDIQFVVLDEKNALNLWKGELMGRERVVVSEADVTFDAGEVALRSEFTMKLQALVYPPLDGSQPTGGIFGRLPVGEATDKELWERVSEIREAGPPRKIPIGQNKVAAAPGDADFARAAAWEIRLPDDFDPAASDALLRIRYRGDVARIRIGDKLVMDDFFNGRPLELGLHRFAKELADSRTLTLEILPFQPDAPVFLPELPKEGPMLSLDFVEIAPRYHARSKPTPR